MKKGLPAFYSQGIRKYCNGKPGGSSQPGLPHRICRIFEVDYSLGYPMVAFDFSFRSTHYTGLSVEKKFIYTLYSGEKAEDISKKGKFPQSVLVFDYDGDIKKSYELDHRLLAFSVDEEGGGYSVLWPMPSPMWWCLISRKKELIP